MTYTKKELAESIFESEKAVERFLAPGSLVLGHMNNLIEAAKETLARMGDE